MDGEERRERFVGWMAATITYAYLSVGVDSLDALRPRVNAIVEDVWRCVQGNRPSGSVISEGDNRLLIQGVLRRCVAIIEMAEAKSQ